MDILKSVFIAFIQGLTEFIPVSSSGHILLLKKLMDLQIDMTFDIVLHLGTLFAVLLIYKNEIIDLINGLFKKSISSKSFGSTLTRKNILRIWILLIISTIPGAISGFLLKDLLDIDPSKSGTMPYFYLSICFFYTMLLLISTKLVKNKESKNINEMKISDAIIIGIFQAIAVLPGISRSGSTLVSSYYVKLNPDHASRYSFLLSIPLIIAAFILELLKLIRNWENTDIQTIIILTFGFFVSFVTGYFTLRTVINFIKKGKLWCFGIYMIIPIIISLIIWIYK